MKQTFLYSEQVIDWLKESGSCENVGNQPFHWLADGKPLKPLAEASQDAAQNAAPIDAGKDSLQIEHSAPQELQPTSIKSENEHKNEYRGEPLLARGEGGVDARDIFREKVTPCCSLSEVLEVLAHEKLGVLQEIQDGASNLVFTDGKINADVLVIGEAPGRDEDRQGLPFVGRSGQLLDKMLASVGLSRLENVLLTNVVFWRPPGNRNPSDSEVLACSPVVEKTIELVAPKIILLTGSVPMQALLKSEMTIGRVRGTPQTLTLGSTGKSYPVLVTFHPSYLLRNRKMKAHAWRDMLMLQKMLGAISSEYKTSR